VSWGELGEFMLFLLEPPEVAGGYPTEGRIPFTYLLPICDKEILFSKGVNLVPAPIERSKKNICLSHGNHE